MKISVNWLQDYVDLRGISAQEMADKLTQITCEVEEVIPVGRGLESVVVGKVLACDAHPQSDHLHVLTVDVAQGEPLQIVCGAPNARAGLTVAVALMGTVMPSGMKIERAKLRGVDSCGMCCSAAELGYTADNDGILELPSPFAAGTPVTEALPGLVDDIIDIDNKSITNRPDLWGHYGIARELAVIFDRKLKPVATSNIKDYDDLPKLAVKIENDNCLSYGAMKVANLAGGASPDFMQNRLYKLGHNSHGFLVDVTNYVMFAFGNPIHAFDARQIGKISVGNIPAGTPFVTLKDNQITATPEMLFIKSDNQPVALAGVMGGKNSEIQPDTEDVVFETATFAASNIRRTSVAVGIRSDASMRYEKALDPETNFLAMAEILRLVKKHAPKSRVVSAYTRVTSPAGVKQPVKIVVPRTKLDSITGVSFAKQNTMLKRKLTALGFQPEITPAQIVVTVPSWRAWKDITTPADVIEEIIRNYGYQNIQPVAPEAVVKPIPVPAAVHAKDALKDALAWQYDFTEAHTNIWYDTKALKGMNLNVPSYATIANPFNKEDNQIRSTMLPSLLTVALANKLQPDVRVFEMGRIINAAGTEEEHLSGVVYGGERPSQTVESAYQAASAMLTQIFTRFGLDLAYRLQTDDNALFHPTNHAEILVQGKAVGTIGIIHPRVLKNTVGFELNLSAVDFAAVPPAQAPVLSKFPKTELDFTFVWDGIYADLAQIFDRFAHPNVAGYRLTAVYENKYTLTFTVVSYEKTLDKTEIGTIHQEIVDFAGKNSVHLNGEREYLLH